MTKFLAALGLACALPIQVYAAALPNLDMTQFTVDKVQDFTTTTSFDTSLWTNVFGSAFWLSGGSDGLWITSNQNSSPAWQQSGIMQMLGSGYGKCSSGFGYGLFHWRARAGQLTQGPGINLIMWRADGLWIDPRAGADVDTEIDALESWDSKGGAVATEHSYDTAASGNNKQAFHGLTFPAGTDITAMHDYDIDWEAGSLTMYVDGVAQWQTLGASVPKDTAHGGCNETIGAQVVIQTTFEPLPTVQLMVANSGHYSAKVAPNPIASTASALTVVRGQAANTITVAGTLNGSAATIKWALDGTYQGTVHDNQQPGAWGATLTLPTGIKSGTHTAVFYTDSNANVSATYQFTF